MIYRALCLVVIGICAFVWRAQVCSAQLELGISTKGGRVLITKTGSTDRGHIDAKSGNWFGFGLVIRDRIQKDKEQWMRAEIGLARSGYTMQQTDGSQCCSTGDSVQVKLTLFYVHIAPEFQIAGKTSLYFFMGSNWEEHKGIVDQRRGAEEQRFQS